MVNNIINKLKKNALKITKKITKKIKNEEKKFNENPLKYSKKSKKKFTKKEFNLITKDMGKYVCKYIKISKVDILKMLKFILEKKYNKKLENKSKSELCEILMANLSDIKYMNPHNLKKLGFTESDMNYLLKTVYKDANYNLGLDKKKASLTAKKKSEIKNK